MSPLLLTALVASPLPLSELSAADLATRAAADGALMDRAVRRSHWLIDAALTTPPPRPRRELAEELTHLLHALDGAQAWWGGPPGDAAGVQAEKAYALHCAGRLALMSLVIAGADALFGDAPPPLAAAARDPALLHGLGPLRRRWRAVRPGLRDRRDDRGRGMGWTVPYIERQSRSLADLRQRAVGQKLPSAPPRPGRLLGGDTRLADWPAGSSLPRHDVALSDEEVGKLMARARPGDVVLTRRRAYAGMTAGPVAAVVLGPWKGLDAEFRGDKEARHFLGMRGVVNHKPTLYMHLRFPKVADAWKALGVPVAAALSPGGVTLSPLRDALRADSVTVLRPRGSVTAKLRAVALGAHHVGRQLSGKALIDACYGPGDGLPGIASAPLDELSGSAGWEVVAARPAGP